MIDLKYIIDPLMGTIIGFGTNFIAVKMLFRPYTEKRIGNFRIPFTPGVIPKRKKDIAKALGDTISKELFTNSDVKEIFLSDEIKEKISNGILQKLKQDDVTLKDVISRNITEEKYEFIKQGIENAIVNKISEGLIEIDIAEIIIKEGAKAVKDSLKDSFFGGFVSEEKIKSMAEPIGIKIEDYIKNNLKQLVLPYIDNEFTNIENNSIEELFKKINISDEKFKEIIVSIYTKIIDEKMQDIFDSLNISEVIQEKINAMDVKEVERLFMIVMKKELNAIVNLGAVLGLILGVVNAFLL